MVETNRQKFLKKYKLENKGYSVSEIAKITGFKKNILEQVKNRGMGARKSNPESVRSASRPGTKPGGKSLAGKMSANQWGMARVYGFVMGNPKQVKKGQPDYDLWIKRK